MDSVSIQDSLLSLGSLSITRIAKAPFSHIGGASAAFLSGDWFGSPKRQQHVPRTLPVPEFTHSQACTQAAVFPLQGLSAPHVLLSSLSGASWLLHTQGMSAP